MNREINYEILIENVKEMIQLLEFDSMRSSGKTKMNSQHLDSLYRLKAIYEAKTTPNKKEG